MNEQLDRILCQSLGEGVYSRRAAALLLERNYKDVKLRQMVKRNRIDIKIYEGDRIKRI